MIDFESKYNGEQVEAILDSVANGEAGGGGGTQGPQGPQGEQGPKGDDGVGIASVVQTTTSSADGGSNVMTVTLSDGTKSTFTVKNGSKGSQGEQGPKGDKGDKGDTGPEGPKGDKGDKGDTGATGANGTNGKDGADGEDGATFTPSVDANGNLSWTNNKGLSNPPAVNIKGPKGDSGEGGGSSGGGKEYVEIEPVFSPMGGEFAFNAVNPIEPNKVYVLTTEMAFLEISSFSQIDAIEMEYEVRFKAVEGGCAINLSNQVLWANGQEPHIPEGFCELSIVATKFGSDYIYKAVLTPFKAAE